MGSGITSTSWRKDQRILRITPGAPFYFKQLGAHASWAEGSFEKRAGPVIHDPFPHHGLFLRVCRDVAFPLNRGMAVTDAQIVLIPAKGLERYLPSDSVIMRGVEVECAASRHDLTTLKRWRRVRDCSPRVIAEKGTGFLVQPLPVALVACGLRRRQLREIGALELVVAGRIMQEIVCRRRVVV